MTEITLALCKTPVLGVAMWLASMCVTNQALKDANVDLSLPGPIVNQSIEIPMDERYSFHLAFRPFDQTDSTAGAKPFASYVCSLRLPAEPGPSSTADGFPNAALVLEVKITSADGTSVRNELLTPKCSPATDHSNAVALGHIDMKRGKYRLAVTNRNPITLNRGGNVKAIFRGQGAGFP